MSEFIFKLPDLGEGTVESEIGEWNIKVGDVVAEEDIVGTMMTDKAAVELVSPVSGTVVSLGGEPGDMVAVGAPLVIFETDGVVGSEKPQENTTQPTAVSAEQTAREAPDPMPNVNGKVMTSPVIRRRAREAGIDLANVPGTGTGGRILPADFDQHLKSMQDNKTPAATQPANTSEVKVIGLRRIIAERMSQANLEVPHFSYVEEVDITALEVLRKHLNEKYVDADRRLTPLPFIGYALIRALKEFPQCNTTFDKVRNVLLRHESVHLGIATQTPDGLKVPVIRDAQSLTVSRLAAEIRRLSEAARTNKIGKDELGGSTITLTSLGKLGGIASTPIINLPEVAIIGVNRAVERPVVVDGKVVVRLMMNLSSSFDHRFVDGYDAAEMIQRIREMLENPATIFIA